MNKNQALRNEVFGSGPLASSWAIYEVARDEWKRDVERRDLKQMKISGAIMNQAQKNWVALDDLVNSFGALVI